MAGQAYQESCENLRETVSLERFSGLKGIEEKAAALSRTDGFLHYNFAPYWSLYLKSDSGKEALNALRRTLKESKYKFTMLDNSQWVLQQAWRVPWLSETRGENDDPASYYGRKFRESVSFQRYRMWVEVLKLYNGDIGHLNDLSDRYWEIGNSCSSFSGWLAQPGGLEILTGRERRRWDSLFGAIGGFHEARAKIDHALIGRLLGRNGSAYQNRLMKSRSMVLRLDHNLTEMLRQKEIPVIP